MQELRKALPFVRSPSKVSGVATLGRKRVPVDSVRVGDFCTIGEGSAKESVTSEVLFGGVRGNGTLWAGSNRSSSHATFVVSFSRSRSIPFCVSTCSVRPSSSDMIRVWMDISAEVGGKNTGGAGEGFACGSPSPVAPERGAGVVGESAMLAGLFLEL